MFREVIDLTKQKLYNSIFANVEIPIRAGICGGKMRKLFARRSLSQKPNDAEIAVLTILRNKTVATPIAVVMTELRGSGRSDVDAQLAAGRLVGMELALWRDAQDSPGAYQPPLDILISQKGKAFLDHHEQATVSN